jgi:adenylate cyclase
LRYLLLSSRKGKILVGAIIGALAWALIFMLYSANLLESYEIKTYDHLCRLKAAHTPAPEEIALVVLDQGSLKAAQEQGINWPWPRQMYAPIIEFCGLAGARAVALDIIFTEPSVYGVEDDKLFAEALKKNGHAFLPISLSRENRPPPSWEREVLNRIALPLEGHSGEPTNPLISSEPPIEILAKSCYGLGNVSIPPSPDGIYRGLPPVFSYRGYSIPSLGMAVFRHLSQNIPVIMKKDGLHTKEMHIPLDDQGMFLLSFYGSTRDFPRFSAFNVIQSFMAMKEGRKPIYPPEAFRDKVVFVGFTALGLFDLKPTPISSLTPGVAVHATLVANLLHKDFRVRISPLISLALAAGLAVTMAVTVMLVPGFLQLAIICLVYGGGLIGIILFSYWHNLWVDAVLPASALALAFSMSTAFSYATEGKQRRQIKHMFSHYMSDLLIQDLLRHPEKLRLGGEKRLLTVFFSDLAGFTTVSEKLLPEEVVTLLNRYLTAMTDLILSSGGIIDKYEGDAIMAFWGAPLPQEDHASRACLAALDNQSRLVDLRREFTAMGLPPIYARIGINTGEMIIGNLGSTQRFDFTVIGDSVNVASRLEGAGKEYGTSIIISEETYRQAREQVEVRELDLLQVKGKDLPVRIYELLGRKGELTETEGQKRELFAHGLALYRNCEWSEAISFFQKVLNLVPDDGPATTFLRRCQYFQENPPGSEWDGVYRLKTK